MRGWIVLYRYGRRDNILPKHYKTEKQANKFAEQHRQSGNRCNPPINCEAVVLNVEDVVAWINSGVNELEALFRL